LQDLPELQRVFLCADLSFWFSHFNYRNK